MLRHHPITTLLVLFIVGALNARAQFTASYVEVDSLIKDGIRKNSAMISERAQNLTHAERVLLLNTNKKGSALYGLLNMASGGLALGSIIQGDPLGYVVGGFSLTMWSIGTTGDRDKAGNGFIGAALVTWLVSWFLPGIYASGENGKLKDALGLRAMSSVSVTTRMDLLANGTSAPVLMLSIGL